MLSKESMGNDPCASAIGCFGGRVFVLSFFKRFAPLELSRSIDAGGHAGGDAGASSQQPVTDGFAFWHCQSLLARTRPGSSDAKDIGDETLATAAMRAPAAEPATQQSTMQQSAVIMP